MIKAEKTGNKKFIKRSYDSSVNGFTLTYTIRVYDAYDVEYKDEYGTFWAYEETTIDKFDMTEKDIERDYDGNISAMWRELKEEFGIAEPATVA